MAFQFQIVSASILHLRICCSKSFRVQLPLLRHVVHLNDGNYGLTMPEVKGRCARDALHQIFNIGAIEYVKKNSATI